MFVISRTGIDFALSLGLNSSSFIGKNIQDFCHSTDVAQMNKHLQEGNNYDVDHTRTSVVIKIFVELGSSSGTLKITVINGLKFYYT